MDVYGSEMSIAGWRRLIDEAYSGELGEPILNVDEARGSHFDAIFVGGGSAGRFGAAVLRSLGGRPLVVERWPFLGGSCPHQACVPHHLFSEAARELDQAQALQGRLWYPKFDPTAASVLELVELFRSQRSGPHAHMNWQSAQQLDIESVVNAEAAVRDARTVCAAGRTFTTDALVLATGARTAMPGIEGETLPGVFDYASFIEDLDYEPRKIVVIGGSKVAVEYASFYRATGTPTTVVSRAEVLTSGGPALMDDDLRGFVVEQMHSRDLELLEHSVVTRILGEERVEGVEVQTPAGRRVIDADFVLLGTGERPNTASFAAALPLTYDERGFVVVDSRMRTNIDGVYAAGDLIGPPLEMFKSRRSGTTAARNIMGIAAEFHYDDIPDFLHTTYEVTWAGLTERQARERYDRVVTIQVPPLGMAPGDTPLPMAEGSMLYGFTFPERTGYQKCVIDADSRRIVGIHHAGYGAKDAFQYLHHLISRPEGLTIDQLGDMNELYISSDYFIGYARLRANQADLTSM
ncbi:dihydrolipoyl dehydrogenase [Actinomycetospora sp. NBRC 106375]|uniref:FAD-dependent oxidoreductase n=1 Tax=Actinomycetospora sp. NBRC 106375 TaxID=3032207 RepID=UPI0024A287A7|nr:FAD-dependent oxidoreductase [Actinomycetospora sp. NBRC 106375]GLZ49325.1 dihydrolipoyl dehydrogenase [Actinomycetospora sp. NBRC 106375]